MARRRLMLRFARWHVWLGWAAALPVLVWIVSGLFMAARPIGDVRGDQLRKAPAPIAAAGLVAPQLPSAVTRMTLAEELGRPVWLVTGADQVQARYNARDGAPLGPVNVIEARQLALTQCKRAIALATARRLAR